MTVPLARILASFLLCAAAHAAAPVGGGGPVERTPAEIPPPSSLDARQSAPTQIVFTWQAVRGAREYHLYVAPPPPALAGGRPAVISGTGTRYVLALPASTPPTVYKASIEAVGPGAARSPRVDFNPVQFAGAGQTAPQPQASLTIRAAQTGPGEVTLQWSPSADRVYRVLRTAPTGQLLCDPCRPPVIDRMAPAPQAEHRAYRVESKSTMPLLPTVAGQAQVDLQPATVAGGGTGGGGSGTGGSGTGGAGTGGAAGTTVPSPPTSVAAAPAVRLSWARASGASEYRIERRTGNDFVPIARVGGNVTEYVDMSGHGGSRYRLIAIGPGGEAPPVTFEAR